MKAQIVITLDGQINIITQEGTFSEGQEAIRNLLAQLEAQGIDVDLKGEIEQHRHEEPEKVQAKIKT